MHSGVGMNLKVGAPIGRKAPENNFLVVHLNFLALKAHFVVLVSAFVMVSTIWSVSCLLFFYSRCPRVQPFVKVGARAPVPYGVGTTACTTPPPLYDVYKKLSDPSPVERYIYNMWTALVTGAKKYCRAKLFIS